jgi:hypothetical protein
MTLADVRQQPVERAGLRDVARIAVEDEPVGGVGTGEPLADEPEHDFVRDQFASIHRGLGALAEVGAARHGIAQQVAGRHLGNALLVAQALRLGALAGTGCAEQYESHDLAVQGPSGGAHPTQKEVPGTND